MESLHKHKHIQYTRHITECLAGTRCEDPLRAGRAASAEKTDPEQADRVAESSR